MESTPNNESINMHAAKGIVLHDIYIPYLSRTDDSFRGSSSISFSLPLGFRKKDYNLNLRLQTFLVPVSIYLLLAIKGSGLRYEMTHYVFCGSCLLVNHVCTATRFHNIVDTNYVARVVSRLSFSRINVQD